MYAMRHIKDNLEAKEGIYGVKLNQAAGSVTVNYDHQRYGVAGIFKALEDVDVIFADLTGAEHIEESPSGSDEAPLDLIGAIDDLSNRLSGLAGTRVDLKSILPLAFFGAGLWSFARSGLMIEKIPGWLFFWLGFDTFVKLHGRSGSGDQPLTPNPPDESP